MADANRFRPVKKQACGTIICAAGEPTLRS